MIDVILADDHDLVRAGLKRILEGGGIFSVVGEAATGGEALALTQSLPADVLVLDISLPDKDGLEVLRSLQDRPGTPPVLILTMHPEREFALQAFQLGAQGYIRKDSPPAELISALRRVASGRRYISVDLAEQMAQSLGEKSSAHPHEGLSIREHQVFLALARGERPADLAASLCLSENTIRTYRSRVLKKLNCRTTADLARYASQRNLL